MNDYRITYTTEAGDSFDSIITERTEAAARKFFTSMNKGLGFTVTNIELHHENTCATKQQERDTLAAIRRMVDELGPQSYLATAFEGAFEDAESNIENDFGDSMKARWEAAEKRVAQAVKETAEAKEELAQVRRELQTAEDDVNFYRDKVLDSDDLTDLAQLVDSYISGLRDKVKAAEAAILEYAEHPETTTFVDAVRGRKNLAKAIEYYQALAQRIKHAQGQ